MKRTALKRKKDLRSKKGLKAKAWRRQNKKRIRHRGRRRITEGNDGVFLDWLRQQKCLVAILGIVSGRYGPCRGVTVPMHVRGRNLTGQDVGNALPGCWHHHDCQHVYGRKSWSRELGIDRHRWAAVYARIYRTALEAGRTPHVSRRILVHTYTELWGPNAYGGQ